ncbi:MAG: hypothetical protein MI919_35665, partial [Holophagales bacterium]|nr:hypothetical protein [Holophagales bacterium]
MARSLPSSDPRVCRAGRPRPSLLPGILWPRAVLTVLVSVIVAAVLAPPPAAAQEVVEEDLTEQPATPVRAAPEDPPASSPELLQLERLADETFAQDD